MIRHPDVSIDIPINAVSFRRKSVKKTPPLKRLKSRYDLGDNVRYAYVCIRKQPRHVQARPNGIYEKSLKRLKCTR